MFLKRVPDPGARRSRLQMRPTSERCFPSLNYVGSFLGKEQSLGTNGSWFIWTSDVQTAPDELSVASLL